MLNRSTSLALSTNVVKALAGKLDIKIHSPSILHLCGPMYKIETNIVTILYCSVALSYFYIVDCVHHIVAKRTMKTAVFYRPDIVCFK